MGLEQAAALPGHLRRAGTVPWGAGDGGPGRWKDCPVHRGGVAHLKVGPGSWAGTTLSGLPLLPEGGPEEYGGVEVRPGPGGAADGLTSSVSWVQRDPQQHVCILCIGPTQLSKRPR